MGRRKIYVEEEEEEVKVEAPRGPVFFLRPRVLGGLAMLAFFAVGSQKVWEHYRPVIARSPQYLVDAERLFITPPPPWIRSDIRHEVLRNAGLVGGVSVLDFSESLPQRLRDAFLQHPWVYEVHRMEVALPAAIKVELTYRQPVAAVEVEGSRGIELLPVDPLGVRLPAGDLTDVEKFYLPRIAGAFHPPLVGRAWEEPQVLAAIRLAIPLGRLWHPLQLAVIQPVHQVQRGGPVVGATRLEIVTNGGTRILWGSPPGLETAAEAPFSEKLNRLQEYANQHGNLDSIDGPATLDVRQEMTVQPRQARLGHEFPVW